jgi:SAM-dependent methyltransferase
VDDQENTSREVQRIRAAYGRYKNSAGLKWSPGNPGNVAMLEERNACVVSLLQAGGMWPLVSKRVLDVGCGGGDLLALFETLGVRREDLFGVDLVAERIESACIALPGANLSVANGETLPFADDSFDLVSLFLVFSSILSDSMAGNLASEVARVLRSGGVLVYDFRVPSLLNRNTRPIPRSTVRRLFPDFTLSGRSLTLLPPLARRLGTATRTIYPVLTTIPWLRTHNLLLLRRVDGLTIH